MEEMVAALLQLARAEATPEEHRPITVSALIERALQDCRPLLDDRIVHLECRMPPNLQVLGSATLLTRAVRNILDNAIRVSPPGGCIEVEAHRDGEQVVLRISDRGPGIAPEEQERIFEPLYQTRKSRTPGTAGGHGLGLAICRRIVSAHGGTVRVLSQPGQGVTFEIRLPAAASTS